MPPSCSSLFTGHDEPTSLSGNAQPTFGLALLAVPCEVSKEKVKSSGLNRGLGIPASSYISAQLKIEKNSSKETNPNRHSLVLRGCQYTERRESGASKGQARVPWCGAGSHPELANMKC